MLADDALQDRLPTRLLQYLVVDDKGAAAAETSDGSQSIFHVSTYQVNVIYLQETQFFHFAKIDLKWSNQSAI